MVPFRLELQNLQKLTHLQVPLSSFSQIITRNGGQFNMFAQECSQL